LTPSRPAVVRRGLSPVAEEPFLEENSIDNAMVSFQHFLHNNAERDYSMNPEYATDGTNDNDNDSDDDGNGYTSESDSAIGPIRKRPRSLTPAKKRRGRKPSKTTHDLEPSTRTRSRKPPTSNTDDYDPSKCGILSSFVTLCLLLTFNVS
jgi:hypothetical protein